MTVADGLVYDLDLSPYDFYLLFSSGVSFLHVSLPWHPCECDNSKKLENNTLCPFFKGGGGGGDLKIIKIVISKG